MALQDRVEALEKQVGELSRRSMRGRRWLKWLGGVIAALGFTSLAFYQHLWESVRNNIASEVQTQVEEALKKDPSFRPPAMASITPAPVSNVPGTQGAAPVPAVHPQPTTQASTGKAKVKLQIDALNSYLDQRANVNFVYTEPTMIHDYGMLTNCVTVFIDEMRLNPAEFNYSRLDVASLYQQIRDKMTILQQRVRDHDSQSNVDQKKWHSEDWFTFFQSALMIWMQRTKTQEPSITQP